MTRWLALFALVLTPSLRAAEPTSAEVLDGLYETTCLKWFLACALRELSVRLESEVYASQLRLKPIRKITFTEDGQVESFLLDSPDAESGSSRAKDLP